MRKALGSVAQPSAALELAEWALDLAAAS
jgi:hypothetical protein